MTYRETFPIIDRPDLPACEAPGCGGPVYRRLREGEWRGPLWHLDSRFLMAEDPAHRPVVTDPPDVLPLTRP